MHKLHTILILNIVMILIMNRVDAVCCLGEHDIGPFWIEHECISFRSLPKQAPIFGNKCKSKICMNGEPLEGIYCAWGKCNIFGCNCDGGCIRNSNGADREHAQMLFKLKYSTELYE